MKQELVSNSPALTDDQVANFDRNGFLIVPNLATAVEIHYLRKTFTKLFSQQAGREEGAFYDLVGHDDTGAPASLPQMIDPMYYAPELRHTALFQAALRVAQQLLGRDTTFANDHAILKPAKHGSSTPWHQDEAYRANANFNYRELSVWIPLQDATLDNGCMHYAAGSHKVEVLTHGPVNDDPKVHALQCSAEVNSFALVPCPISAGDVAVHHGRTAHYAGPNSTNAPRYAYVLIFEAPPTPAERPRDYPWNLNRNTAAASRRRAWLLRGGFLLAFSRKILRALKNPKRYLNKLKSGA